MKITCFVKQNLRNNENFEVLLLARKWSKLLECKFQYISTIFGGVFAKKKKTIIKTTEQ